MSSYARLNGVFRAVLLNAAVFTFLLCTTNLCLAQSISQTTIRGSTATITSRLPTPVAFTIPPPAYLQNGLFTSQVLTPPGGSWNGIGVADLSNVPGMPGPAVLSLSASGGGFRKAINPATGNVIWSLNPSPMNPNECVLNINSTVAVIGSYIFIGQSSYSASWGNGTGRVCVYNALTGAYINTVLGFYGGELFGSSILGLNDANTPGVDYVAIAAPRRWSSQHSTAIGAVDVFRISDIITTGLYTSPVYTREGPWQQPFMYLFSSGSTYNYCDGYEFGAALANLGDINNDGIDDFVTSDPGFCGTNGTSWIATFDSRRTLAGAFSGYGLRSSTGLFGNRMGHSLAILKGNGKTRILAADPYGFGFFGSQPFGAVSILDLSANAAISFVGELAFQPAPSQGFQVAGLPSGLDARFGWGVVNVGDITGDGLDDIAVAEAGRDGSTISQRNSGAIHTYSGALITGMASLGIVPELGWFSSNSFNVRLGYGRNSIAGIPDVNGDGIRDLVAGAPWEAALGGTVINFGALFVLHR